ncbi:MAG TPA: DUF2946 family protein [Luteimonas sp.]|nr:DUF2946 family protein [Luteimonas sp.]HRO25926.1 DUF2946 family protein [Luteimonas sp.]HRP73038.1 DUF2946 family protein [Luteimonas sp.]
MTRSTALFRRMAWLALAAALLATAMPTVSRALSVLLPQSVPVWMEMCTTAGTQLVDVSPFLGEQSPPQPQTGAVDACDYCVLATPLPLVLALLAVCLLAPASRLPRLRATVPLLRSPRNLRGLGSQAPPLAL